MSVLDKPKEAAIKICCEMFMTTKQRLHPIYLNDIRDYWTVEDINTIIPNPVNQKPQKPKKKWVIVGILVNIGLRSNWSGGGRAKCEWEINPQDCGRRSGRDESAYNFKARPKNDMI